VIALEIIFVAVFVLVECFDLHKPIIRAWMRQ